MTYIPMARGFVYLVAVMDWCTRKVLARRLSNSLSADFCVEALEEAIAKFGVPEIFNTDQGAQFTSAEFIGVLKHHQIRISMDWPRPSKPGPRLLSRESGWEQPVYCSAG